MSGVKQIPFYWGLRRKLLIREKGLQLACCAAPGTGLLGKKCRWAAREACTLG